LDAAVLALDDKFSSFSFGLGSCCLFGAGLGSVQGRGAAASVLLAGPATIGSGFDDDARFR
jgi:hypothetical protein